MTMNLVCQHFKMEPKPVSHPRFLTSAKARRERERKARRFDILYANSYEISREIKNFDDLNYSVCAETCVVMIMLNFLNYEPMEELATVDGVGNRLAAEIVKFRNKNGRFNSVAELRFVPGWTKERYFRFLVANQLRP